MKIDLSIKIRQETLRLMGAIGALDPHLFKKIRNKRENENAISLINDHFKHSLHFIRYIQKKSYLEYCPDKGIYKFFSNLIEQEDFPNEKELILNLAYKLKPIRDSSQEGLLKFINSQ